MPHPPLRFNIFPVFFAATAYPTLLLPDWVGKFMFPTLAQAAHQNTNNSQNNQEAGAPSLIT